LLSFSKPFTTHHSPLTIITGPEVLTGSTRLKAGTATKLVLNMLTTISMIRLGKVVSNLMVDVKPTNEKLRARACRIVAELRHCSEGEARRRLQRANWRVKLALR
jgi:N-acetylmuramic acid 6-phosphate etherase